MTGGFDLWALSNESSEKWPAPKLWLNYLVWFGPLTPHCAVWSLTGSAAEVSWQLRRLSHVSWSELPHSISLSRLLFIFKLLFKKASVTTGKKIAQLGKQYWRNKTQYYYLYWLIMMSNRERGCICDNIKIHCSLCCKNTLQSFWPGLLGT